MLGKKAVSVFSGGIIDEDGSIHILDMNPRNQPQKFTFSTPAVDLVSCKSFSCILTSDGQVLMDMKYNNDSQGFVEVQSLKSKEIIKLSGSFDTCAALSSDGRVFVFGNNISGQLGDGTTADNYESFTEIHSNEEIIDVSCPLHTLYLTKSNKIFGIGCNEHSQLMKDTNDDWALSPTEIAAMKADKMVVCVYHSFVLSGTGKIENPAKKFFNLGSRVLKRLNDLQQQNESFKREIESMSQEISKLKEFIKFIIDQED